MATRERTDQRAATGDAREKIKAHQGRREVSERQLLRLLQNYNVNVKFLEKYRSRTD